MADPRFLVSARIVDPRPARRGDAEWAVPVPNPAVWRLVGANNRELGRSAQSYVDARACRQGVTLLRRQLPQLTPVVWSDGRGRWLWRLDVDRRPVAVAARSYLRQREAHYNLELFLSSVPVARLPELPPRPGVPPVARPEAGPPVAETPSTADAPSASLRADHDAPSSPAPPGAEAVSGGVASEAV